MSNDSLNLREVREFLEAFAVERGWVKYHTPKNLAMALAAEAGELLEIFQWMTPGECMNLTAQQRIHAGEELADITIYALRLFDVLGIDPESAVIDKIGKNGRKYPSGKRSGVE